ncbi:MAG TPA: sugar transferase [Clostridia bacterium]|nr:sugar transferase [Clostridia bacterium]
MSTAKVQPDSGVSNAVAASPALRSAVKRGIDVTFAALLLVCLSPLLAALALLVKLQDGGAVIYRRRVVGTRGEFDAFKFRTMRPDADRWLAARPELMREFERNFKLADDPRVTFAGALMRKFSLDELPQLFNVVRGEMSLVGPRMITAAELEKYGANRDLLLTVRPGLTGYWQVNGRQSVSYEDRVQMDVFYIRHWSIAMDFAIIAKTPFAILVGKGAY